MGISASNAIQERKQRWNDFLSMDKPVKHVFLIDIADCLPTRPFLWPSLKNERIEWIWEKYCRYMEQVEWLEDDRIPYLDMLTGTEVFAEAFGCKVHRPKDNNPFALPLIHETSEVSKLKRPKLEDSPLMLLFEMADELKKRAGKHAIFKLPDIQSPLDISALIWDKNTFYIALLEEPEAVKELASMVKELLVEFLDTWFARYGREYIAHFPDYYMEGGITLSEDEIGVVSSEMFEELFLPELTELSGHFGGLGMHCCANAQHQWENMQKIPGLRLLNFVQPKEVLVSAYKFFAHHVPQMHSWCGDGPAWTWVEKYPEGSRVAMQIAVNSRDEALEVSEKLRIACGRE